MLPALQVPPAPLDRQERLVLLALLDRPAKMGKEEPPARRVLQVLPALLDRQGQPEPLDRPAKTVKEEPPARRAPQVLPEPLDGQRGATGPTGAAGATGATGPTGSTGPQGPIAGTIPFSFSNRYESGAELATDDTGNPTQIAYAGFGGDTGYYMYLNAGEWTSGTITIRESQSYPSSFVMPYDGTLQNIYGVFANRQSLNLEAGVTLRPFLCLATGSTDSLVFQILQETMIYFPPYVSGEEIPKYSIRRANLTGLNISLPAGTLIAIIMGITAEGSTQEQYTTGSISGGIFIE